MAREADNTLSVVASTDDESFVEELERLFEGDAKLIVVSTRALRTRRAQAVQVLPFESAYRRNRGLALAAGDVVAFLEEGQLPAREWQAAVLRPFTGDPRPAAVAAGLPLHVGGNVAYDRRRLLGVHGFPLFTGAEPGSPVPDLLALLRLRSDRGGVATAQGMTLVRGGVAPSRDAEVLGRMLRARHAHPAGSAPQGEIALPLRCGRSRRPRVRVADRPSARRNRRTPCDSRTIDGERHSARGCLRGGHRCPLARRGPDGRRAHQRQHTR